MSYKKLGKSIITSLILALPILITACSEDGGEDDLSASAKAISDTGLVGTWEGECQFNSGNLGNYSQRVREFRSDLTFSFIINSYVDSNCSKPVATGEFAGRFSGGKAIELPVEVDLIQIDFNYESAFLSLRNLQIVDEFNAQNFDCPTSRFILNVNYDVTNCDTTFEERPLPVKIFNVFKIVENELGFSIAAFSDEDRVKSIKELDFKRASNTSSAG